MVYGGRYGFLFFRLAVAFQTVLKINYFYTVYNQQQFCDCSVYRSFFFPPANFRLQINKLKKQKKPKNLTLMVRTSVL